MSQVIEKVDIIREFLKDLDDLGIDLEPLGVRNIKDNVSFKKDVLPIASFILFDREKREKTKERIGFMMITPKDKLSEEESVEIYLNPSCSAITADRIGYLQDKYFSVLRIKIDVNLVRRR